MSIGSWFSGLWNGVKTDAENFALGVYNDAKAWVSKEEAVVIADAEAAWAAVKVVLVAAEPGEWAILQNLVATAKADLAAGDITGIVSDVLSKAVTEETVFITKLGPQVLAAIVAVINAGK